MFTDIPGVGYVTPNGNVVTTDGRGGFVTPGGRVVVDPKPPVPPQKTE